MGKMDCKVALITGGREFTGTTISIDNGKTKAWA